MTVTLELLDPSTLLVDRNIRDAHLDKPFLASIKEHGVLVPIVAVRSDADVRVRYGHRRTLAAVEAGTTTVPVVIVGDEDDDTIARIVGQWTENEHRSALTTSERIGAVHQLALLGLSAGQIARRTKSAKDDVGAALLAGASELATKAAARYDYLELDQSAALAEFEGDDEAVTALVVAAKDGRVHFDRAIDAAREKSEERAARAAAADALFAAGCALVDRPAWESAVTALTRLTDAEGSELTRESHEQCTGHAAWLDADWARAAETPEGTDDDDDATWVRTYLPVYVCVDPVALGHLGGRKVSSTSNGTDDSAATEAAKLARRVTIANNKAWREAEPIRRQWVSTLLARKTAPKGSAAFLVASLLGGERKPGDHRDVVAELLGVDASIGLDELAAGASDARALVVALGVALAGYEAELRVDTWRSSWAPDHRYFAWLAANGYPLSDVEAMATGSAHVEKHRVVA